ncbi:MAG: hypothetical protein ACE5G8_13720, partial [Anaerolineae bacterium]
TAQCPRRVKTTAQCAGGQIAIPLWPGHYTPQVEGYTPKGERFFGHIEIDIAAGDVLEWPLYFNPR